MFMFEARSSRSAASQLAKDGTADFLRFMRSLALFIGFCGFAHAADLPKPNVLLICVDDLKPLLGCYADKTVKSPNIDRLAARGMVFERAYCNQAVCSPSRNALLTGLRPQTVGIYDLGTHFRVATPEAVTLPQHFKANGYRTEAMGKIFHVGHGNHEDPDSWSVPHWQAKTIGYALPENQAPQMTREEARFANAGEKKAWELPRGAAYESADVADNAYGDGKIADEAIRRLAAAKNRQEPFFMAVGFLKPHLPFVAPKKYWDLYDPASFKPAENQKAPEGAPDFAPTTWGELRQYKDMPEQGPLPEDKQRTLIHGYHAAVSFMDAQLGRVLDALDQNGLTEKTIIVLWGDHGWHLGDHGQWCKHTNYEQATRVPLILCAPGVTEPGSRNSNFVETVDIYPTLAELAGLPAPRSLDGVSIIRKANAETKARDHVIHVYPRGPILGRAVRTERYRLVEWKKPGAGEDTAVLELYDYQQDPGETKNFAKDQPAVVAELRALLAKHPEAKPQIKAAPISTPGKGKAGKAKNKPAAPK